MGYKVPGFLVWLIKGREYWLWTTGNLWSGKQWAKEGWLSVLAGWTVDEPEDLLGSQYGIRQEC